MPPRVVLGGCRDFAGLAVLCVGVAAFAALLAAGWLVACPVVLAARWLAGGMGVRRRRAIKEASVVEQNRFQTPEAVERPAGLATADVSPEEFARLAALAGREARTIRLLLTARVPGMQLVIPAGPFVVAGRSYRIVTPK